MQESEVIAKTDDLRVRIMTLVLMKLRNGIITPR